MSWWKRLLARTRGVLVALLAVCGLLVLYDETPLGALGRMSFNKVFGTRYKGPSPLAAFSGAGGRSYGFLLPVDERVVNDVQAATTCIPSADLERVAKASEVDVTALAGLISAYAQSTDDACTVQLPAQLEGRAVEALPKGTSRNDLRADPLLAARGLARLLTAEQRRLASQRRAPELAVESLLLGRKEVNSAIAAASAAGAEDPYDFEQHRNLLPTGASDRADRAVWVLTRVRLANLVWPTEKSFRMTSPFGERFHPITKTRKFHNGVDIAMPEGTPLRAVLDGTVYRVGYDNISGNYLKVNYGLGIQSVFCHLRQPPTKSGAVWRAEQVALSGNTGRSTGPHLHFTMRLYGRSVDPMKLYQGEVPVKIKGDKLGAPGSPTN